jgi:KaiC/GvpD/RAD55 family RecA-like ATPase
MSELRLNQKAKEYLNNVRKLSDSTLEAYRIRTNDTGQIIIPFFDDMKHLRMVKYRHETGGMLKYKTTDKDNKQIEVDVKTYAKPGGTAILLGTHLVTDMTKTLYICYGDYDSMSAYEAGFVNATSLPYGDSGQTWITNQFDMMESIERIVFVPDVDNKAKTKATLMKKLDEMAMRLGKHKCYMTQEKFMLGCKDLNELLQKHGIHAITKCLTNVIPVPEVGLIRLAEYERKPYKMGTAVGMTQLDKATAGFQDGGLTIISGDNNAGKSTLLCNFIAKFISKSEGCFYWSGEQNPDQMRRWVELVIAGPNFLQKRIDKETGAEYYVVDEVYIPAIEGWYLDKLFTYDKRSVDTEKFFEVLELCVRRYGIKKVFIDNLMAFTGSSDNYLQTQGDFVESCKMFAEDWGVHVFVIAHNKKTENEIANKDDVEGSKKVTNWADKVIQLVRVFPHMSERYGGANGIISLCKNRDTEHLVDVRTFFEPKSKRIVEFVEKDEKTNFILGWEQQAPYELESSGKMNF